MAGLHPIGQSPGANLAKGDHSVVRVNINGGGKREAEMKMYEDVSTIDTVTSEIPCGYHDPKSGNHRVSDDLPEFGKASDTLLHS